MFSGFSSHSRQFQANASEYLPQSRKRSIRYSQAKRRSSWIAGSSQNRGMSESTTLSSMRRVRDFWCKAMNRSTFRSQGVEDVCDGFKFLLITETFSTITWFFQNQRCHMSRAETTPPCWWFCTPVIASLDPKSFRYLSNFFSICFSCSVFAVIDNACFHKLIFKLLLCSKLLYHT